MFSHIYIGVSDFERAFSFYTSLMNCLGIEARFCDRGRPWAGWQSAGASRPFFFIGTPYDKLPHAAGNGQMIAFLAGDRATVDKAYQLAVANGSASEGIPGLRPEYHENYYGAYFRDPDGNKLCVACHAPQAIEILR
jgi:lactoylglutathione lyase